MRLDEYVDAAELRRLLSTLTVIVGAIFIFVLFAMIVVPGLVRAVAAHCEVTPNEVAGPSLRRRALVARALVCQLAVRRHGFSLRAVARALGISKQSVTRAVGRCAMPDADLVELEQRLG